tara:strand:- start:68 stop:703 length:636 start_codon:yes stop_codon:yes gene_type:complete
MAQHDYVIANADGATVRADINSVLQAISSNNSGSSDPSTTYAYQFYYDTGDNKLKLRNAANDAFITLGTFTHATGSGTTTIVQSDANQTFSKAQRGSITTQNATTGGAITLDMANNNYFILSNNAGAGTLGSDNSGAYTLANPSNLTAGQSGSIFVTQDGTGGRTLSYGSNFDFAGGTAPTLSTAAGAVDRIDYVVLSSSSIHAVATLDVK